MRIATFSTRCMGSPLRLTVVGAEPRRARAARDAAWNEMAAADAELSRFSASSDLSRANVLAGSGTWVVAGRRLRTLLATSARAQRLTRGRYDPRVLARLEAMGEHGGVALPMTSVEEGSWLERRGRREVRVAAPVDSGGLGKGLGLRWAVAAARRAAPAAGLLLEAGGDLAIHGNGPGGRPWSIGIEDPRDARQLLATLRIERGAVATSSISVRRWAWDGQTVHHIVDPASGRPADSGLLAVTVAGPDPAWAEVLTKSLFIAGRATIGDEARAMGLAAWWVEEDGSLHMTPAARPLTAWTRHEGFSAWAGERRGVPTEWVGTMSQGTRPRRSPAAAEPATPPLTSRLSGA